MTDSSLPLAGYRVLDYSQFVAGPLATMLLADLGADVVKVESPAGDAYRHYEPLGGAESRRFYALNRNKRSVVCDLKTDEGRALSRDLLASADAVVHNMPPMRAVQFGLDDAAVRASNPQAVVAVVSAFGSDGPHAGRVGYDLIAQAYSGLLMADARAEDTTPRRSGGIPYSDITAGLLACISVTAGLASRAGGERPHFEVSLLGAALATQVQLFVRTEGDTSVDGSQTPVVTGADLKQIATDIAGLDVLEPYYRCYEASDGFFALACLTTAQRQRVLDLLGLADPWVGNPQAPPKSDQEHAARAAMPHRFAELFGEHPVNHWVARLAEASVPAGDVRLNRQLFDDEQVRANGLVRRVVQTQGGTVDLLGSLFKINGVPGPAPMAAPQLGEHTAEVVAELRLAADSGGIRVN
ncbi:CaiB/BaiF CoA transferase family protein [Amycolatopsis sp. H20-H5]|uniref:CaiB/BaiF CoA transferase family protein n=1 Tax=Amycolatopsis sp. H20-H5 TaxID=3046309 RepID=UPI002DBD6FBB|nr:CoA transferase [Amycolatopsis sp. H20-H5]MEC3979053.1 CoA transferase [Amycolatopsis sp. H20-H5]